MVVGGNSSQEYCVNAGFLQGSILCPLLFILYIEHPDSVICNTAIDPDDAFLYSRFQISVIGISDMWQQLDLASELKSDLQDTVDWSRK